MYISRAACRKLTSRPLAAQAVRREQLEPRRHLRGAGGGLALRGLGVQRADALHDRANRALQRRLPRTKFAQPTRCVSETRVEISCTERATWVARGSAVLLISCQ